ncbi:hypothetical protein F1880_005521 [Penicillium rolfsii]|nr:hypothetical protein F1880_005521 [Penicillium rolfsii]
MYHIPGDIIICPRIWAAEESTREPAAACSWSEPDLLCWGTEKPPRRPSMSEWEEDWPER